MMGAMFSPEATHSVPMGSGGRKHAYPLRFTPREGMAPSTKAFYFTINARSAFFEKIALSASA